jgi:hypothetical protein
VRWAQDADASDSNSDHSSADGDELPRSPLQSHPNRQVSYYHEQ